MPPCGGTGVRRMRLDIRKEELEALREKYPQGCRVELVRMDDPYREMPPGMRGVVTGVDDSGSIHVHWQNGSSLAVVFGEDEYRTDSCVRMIYGGWKAWI